MHGEVTSKREYHVKMTSALEEFVELLLLVCEGVGILGRIG